MQKEDVFLHFFYLVTRVEIGSGFACVQSENGRQGEDNA